MRPRKSSSTYTISSGSESDPYAPSPSPPPAKRSKVTRKTANAPACVASSRPHGPEYHSTSDVITSQDALLDWFEQVRDKRRMPWRKPYDPDLSPEAKGQRAYEIWVSEVMLQQTQVSTVIAYWNRWIAKWPTIADLAKADLEEVNAMWRGLGYYRRARSLLEGAKTIMSNPKYKGRLPSDPIELEKGIPGVGKYTAGAICSTAYGTRTPLVDGNVHRLLTRLLAIHASQTGPATIKQLWKSAAEMVDALPDRPGVAGDWNQALMELGSQVCKPTAPDCGSCPLRSSCKAYAEVKRPPPQPTLACTLCEPIPTTIPSVCIFPMRKEKKTSREEHEVVCILEWRSDTDRRWLFTKRPDKGLLAGLYEPPTTPIPPDSTSTDRERLALESLSTYVQLTQSPTPRYIASVPHIFSHINMTYHVVHVLVEPPPGTTLPPTTGIWYDADTVESANVGTGVKKVWAAVYGSWGRFEAKTAPKTIRKVMMPLMPRK
ncbi:DNA glycosylase [Kockovaella imperatae]|uniref:Adenine DNA glycosylase n=1 Tax=Kockovaella imperatae TaxID=4999 RepID=A0A1Y1UIC8_9TREE|nr:DNA glycosylase [Kockovaella imperatae]ORX36845.1 DNA glycosylase [Kockovaella imperatae]